MATFKNWITDNGSSGFPAEAGRYHLYVSLACPWAHRVMIVRALKGLEDVISVTVVDWFLDDKGWKFCDNKARCKLDDVNKCNYLKEVYLKAKPDYNGAVNVPCLWDRQKQTIVNDDSSDILRMLNAEFNKFCKTEEQRKINLYPQKLRANIDEVNEWTSSQINHGVYRCGFARSQEDYDKAVQEVFGALDRAEAILGKKLHVAGQRLTEADIRLFTTLVRFDSVYHTHFKTNKRRIVDYPNLWAYTRAIYQLPGVAYTVEMRHITKHYYRSDKTINPSGIVPVGPELDFTAPHSRQRSSAADE